MLTAGTFCQQDRFNDSTCIDTINSGSLLTELCPSSILYADIVSVLLLKNDNVYFHVTWYKDEPITEELQKTKTITLVKCNSGSIFNGITSLVKCLYGYCFQSISSC